MKRVAIHLLLLALPLLIGLTSCDPVNNGEDNPPVPENVYSISINGQVSEIKSAALYYDSKSDGYDIVFFSDELDLSKSIDSFEKGVLFAIDIPGCDMGGKSNLPTIIQGDDWGFYFGYCIDGVWARCEDSRLIGSSSIKSGTLEVYYKQSQLNFDFVAVTNDNVKVECKYLGTPKVATSYLWE